jgi:MFS family permease
MIVGCLLQAFFLLGCIVSSSYERSAVTVIILMVTSVLAGLGQAFTSVVSCEYISNCATENTKGFYFGYFWVFYMSS